MFLNSHRICLASGQKLTTRKKITLISVTLCTNFLAKGWTNRNGWLSMGCAVCYWASHFSKGGLKSSRDNMMMSRCLTLVAKTISSVSVTFFLFYSLLHTNNSLVNNIHNTWYVADMKIDIYIRVVKKPFRWCKTI